MSHPEKTLNPPNCSLATAATQFLLTLSSDKRLKAQQEIHKFVRWFGEALPLDKLTIPGLEIYIQQIRSTTPETAEKLKAIKDFLSYAYKQGLTTKNLANVVKPKKGQSPTNAPRTSLTKATLTRDGYAKLEAELEALRKERPKIAAELQKAAADKDLRENAPFEAIKEYQGQVEARIKELEMILKNATIITEQQEINRNITIGNTIKLRDLTTGEIVTYTLVDSKEANPMAGKISIASPLGQALLGRSEGQKVEVKAPAGTLLYQIEAITGSEQI